MERSWNARLALPAHAFAIVEVTLNRKVHMPVCFTNASNSMLIKPIAGGRKSGSRSSSRRNSWVIASAMLIVLANAHALADPEQGLPLIQTFSPSVFDSPATPVGAQAFDIERAADRALLVSNNEGLLRLDGTGWRTWNPVRGSVLASAARDDGRVFVGAVNDLGYFDHFGGEFVSLRDWSAKLEQPFGEFWTVLANDTMTWFVDRERAYRWNGQRLEMVYTAQGEMRQGALLDASAVILDPGAGLILLAGNPAYVIPGSERLIGAGNCVLGKSATTLVTLCNDGVLRLWSSQTQVQEVTLQTTVARQMAQARPSAVAALPSGGYAVATRYGGLFLFEPGGALQGILANQSGLDNARIFSLLATGADGLWLGRDYGLAMIEWPGQVSRFDIDNGLPRMPQGVGRLDGRMYLVSSAGIFRVESGTGGFARAEPFALIGTSLFEVTQSANALFVTSTDGLYALESSGARQLDKRLSYVACFMDGVPARLLVGGEHGAWMMEHGVDGWRAVGNVPGISSEIRRIVAEGPSTVWLASRSARQLFRMSWKLDANQTWSPESTQVEDFSDAAGVSPGPVRPIAFPDGLVFASASGLFRFDNAQRRFIPDAALNLLLPRQNGEVRSSLPLDKHRVIVVQHDRYRMLQFGAEGWSEQTSPLARIPRGAWPRALFRDTDDTIWVTTSDAVYRHRPELQSVLPSLLPPRVELERAPLILESSIGSDALHLGVAPQSLALRFAGSVYVGADDVQFRSRLLPVEPEWGEWSKRSVRELGFVPGGDFVLEVQTRDIFDRHSRTNRFGFHLDRPWYQRGWALALYAVALVGGVWLIVRWRDRQLRARALALERQIRERTQALEIASVTDQLTGLHNRRYFEIATRALFAQGSSTLVALIDLDHFKRINDTLGHDVGDQVLTAVAHRLVNSAPRSSVLFRWGGEEFLLLVPLPDGYADAESFVRSILHRVGDTPITTTDNASMELTCSIGWEIAAQSDATSIRESLRLADLNLYAAKNGGRDRVYGANAAIYHRLPS